MIGSWRVFLTVGGILAVAAAASPAAAQENLDQGKTAAQLYASDCAICHKSPQGLGGKGGGLFGLQGFLRQHYTASRESAAAIATYLDAVGNAPAAAAKPVKRPSKKGDDAAKAGEKPGEKKPDAGKPADAKSGETKPAEAKGAEPKPSESKPSESKSEEPKASEVKPSEPKSSEPKSGEQNPVAAPAADKPAKSD
jgi:hypothetical protein